MTKEEQIKEAKDLVKHFGLENCKRCYGRGYTRYDIKEKKLVICKCLKKELYMEYRNRS